VDNSTLNTQHSTLQQALAIELEELEERGLKRARRVLETPQGARVKVDGRDYIAFCSNDYLGLAAHPALIEAAREGAARYGVGAGASHLILGHVAAHHELEERLAAFVSLPRALLFATGYKSTSIYEFSRKLLARRLLVQVRPGTVRATEDLF